MTTTIATTATDQVVARLKQAIDPWAPGAQPHTVILARSEALQLLEKLRELCAASPDTSHHDCPLCGAPVCTACGLGEPAGCADRHGFEDHCLDCVYACPVCRGAVA